MSHEESQEAPPIHPDEELESFLGELDGILNEGRSRCRSRTQRLQCTRDLLTAADDLYEASTIPELIRKDEEAFYSRISNNSRVYDGDGTGTERAVIDLVQQGGGMLGIGLLGYTYIMERAGVRFHSMAGTSAGAINTLLLSSIPKRTYTKRSCFGHRNAVKSELLAYLVANENFLGFLDGRGLVAGFQRWLLKHMKLARIIIKSLKVVIPVFLLGLSYLMYWLFTAKLFNSTHHFTQAELVVFHFLIAIFALAASLILLALLIFGIFKRNMGINPGDFPLRWMNGFLDSNFIDTCTTEKLMKRRADESKPFSKLHESTALYRAPRLVFIAANLTHNRIVKFPENCGDYWSKAYAKHVSPAAFVRASMSLPFIFHPFFPDGKHIQGGRNQPSTGAVDLYARFVDGGMLSNFPIREFHTPEGLDPQFPTFGVLLGDLPGKPTRNTAESKKKFFRLSVFKYVVSFISTFRNFYDSEFLTSHKEFSMLVKAVNTDEFNLLDFNMSTPNKIALFCEGARTAIEQLENFEWNLYLSNRKK